MKAKEYKLLQECIERGTAYGLQKAAKHSTVMSVEGSQRFVEDAIMFEICEYFDFEETK